MRKKLRGAMTEPRSAEESKRRQDDIYDRLLCLLMDHYNVKAPVEEVVRVAKETREKEEG